MGHSGQIRNNDALPPNVAFRPCRLACLHNAVVAVVAIALGSSAHAIPTDVMVNGEYLDVDYFVGTGTNTSYLVVDFDVSGGDTYAFGYRWNDGDDARGFTMIEAVTSFIDGLAWTFGGVDGVGLGAFVDTFSYPTFDEVSQPGNFWAYWTGETNVDDEPIDFDPGFDWEFASNGISGRVLQDGSIDGWYNDFNGVPPGIPTIPAPPALGLLLPVFFRRGQRR